MTATDAVMVDDDGRPTLYVGPQLREGLPPVVLEGLARRRLVALGQDCPCGARMVVPNRAARRSARGPSGVAVLSVDIEHEDDCAAIAPELEQHVRRWSR